MELREWMDVNANDCGDYTRCMNEWYHVFLLLARYRKVSSQVVLRVKWWVEVHLVFEGCKRCGSDDGQLAPSRGAGALTVRVAC